jgi:hypothetical protein
VEVSANNVASRRTTLIDFVAIHSRRSVLGDFVSTNDVALRAGVTLICKRS